MKTWEEQTAALEAAPALDERDDDVGTPPSMKSEDEGTSTSLNTTLTSILARANEKLSTMVHPFRDAFGDKNVPQYHVRPESDPIFTRD